MRYRYSLPVAYWHSLLSFRKLEQSASFRPLMRKLVSLAAIARLAGNHQIVRIVRAIDTRNRYYVIYMILLAYPFTAIVAATTLADMLIVNILNGMAALNISHPSPSLSASYSMFCQMGGMVLFMALLNLIYVSSAIVSLICYFGVSIDKIAFFAISTKPFAVIPVIPADILFVLLISMDSTVFFLICIYTLFIVLRILFDISNFALFALGDKAIRLAFVSMEKLFSSREFIFALGAAFLRYNITHGTSPLSCVSSRLGVFEHRSGKPIFRWVNYTTNPPPELVYKKEVVLSPAYT